MRWLRRVDGTRCLVALAVVGCGGGEGGPGGTSGAGGEEGGDAPRPLVVCAPAERPTVDGECVPVGLTAEDCAAGFSFEPSTGCLPVRPDEACPAGEMAIPGEAICRPVAPCGDGPWPQGLPDAGVIFVDAAAAPGGDGTMASPFVGLDEAVTAASTGATLALAAGSYLGLQLVDKTLHLVGRCPSMVAILGASPVPGALLFGPGSDGSSARGVALTGEGVGLGVSGASGIVADHLWVHHTAADGVVVSDQVGPADLDLRDSLMEQTGGIGLTVASAAARVLRCEVRDTVTSGFGDGLGVRVIPSEFTADSGRGTLTIEASWVHRAPFAALFVEASAADVSASVISDVIPNSAGSAFGVFSQLDTTETVLGPAEVSLTQSAVLGARDVGLLGLGTEMSLDRVTVADVDPIADGTFGRGVEVFLPQSRLQVTKSSIVDVHETALAVIGAEADIDDVRVSGVASAVGISRGVSAQEANQELAPGALRVARSHFEGISELGVFAMNLEAFALEDAFVADVRAPAGGRFGDGVVVIDGRGTEAPRRVRRSVVTGSSRAGLGVFGAELTLEASRFSCNDIHLNGESIGGHAPTIADLGGNLCECDGVEELCKVLSTGLDPPGAL